MKNLGIALVFFGVVFSTQLHGQVLVNSNNVQALTTEIFNNDFYGPLTYTVPSGYLLVITNGKFTMQNPSTVYSSWLKINEISVLAPSGNATVNYTDLNIIANPGDILKYVCTGYGSAVINGYLIAQ
jgi:hypothetical protein